MNEYVLCAICYNTDLVFGVRVKTQNQGVRILEDTAPFSL